MKFTDEIQLRLDKVHKVQGLVALLVEKGNTYNKWIDDELASIKAEITRAQEVLPKHSPEPVKRLSVEDLERLMSRPTYLGKVGLDKDGKKILE